MITDLPAGPGWRGCTDPRNVARCRRSAQVPARMLVAGASKQQLGGQVFWLTALNGPGQPSRLAAVASLVQKPGRIQRRPRDGFAPSSLFSSAAPAGALEAQVEFASLEAAQSVPVSREATPLAGTANEMENVTSLGRRVPECPKLAPDRQALIPWPRAIRLLFDHLRPERLTVESAASISLRGGRWSETDRLR